MQTHTSPRKPWLALLMSLVLPGFGQLYNGEVNKAIWLFLVLVGLALPGVVIAALYLPDALNLPALLVSQAALVGIMVWSLVDAWRTARRLDQFALRPWQLSGIYMLILIGCDFVLLPALTGYLREHQLESLRVPSASMMPTVLQGDVFFADKRYNCLGCGSAVQRGDVVVLAPPNDRTLLYIKRVIGLPGDHVEVRDQQVLVNGRSLTVATPAGGTVTEGIDARRWQVQWSGHPDRSLAPTDVTVAPGQVFVMGDNRYNSLDSRYIGTVGLRDIVGKARQVWFSIGTDGIRWQRVGLPLN